MDLLAAGLAAGLVMAVLVAVGLVAAEFGCDWFWGGWLEEVGLVVSIGFWV